eukprot:TRINITY_DN4827_c1_g1_i1.p1 TRINITY_DN4827_c1_g1~~TRINITY_DN4827_c1_g1_i1.p1  ORF type:complete len:572 (+),score=89.26 TRINITY_DN4827_c1_g1_i1:45-1718(+)
MPAKTALLLLCAIAGLAGGNELVLTGIFDSLPPSNYGGAHDMVKHGNYLYAAQDGGSIDIYRTDTSPPTLTNTLADVGKYASGLQVGNGLLFAQFATTVGVYNIATNPESPILLREVELRSASCIRSGAFRGVTVSADHLFVTCYESAQNYLVIFSKNAALTKISTTQIPGFFSSTKDMVYDDGKLYAVQTSAELQIIDVSSPSTPVLGPVMSVPNPNVPGPVRIAVKDGFLYMSTTFVSGMGDKPAKIDISTGAVEVITVPSVAEGCRDIELHNSRIYLACVDNGLVVLQEAPGMFSLLAHRANDGSSVGKPKSLVVEDSTLYLSNNERKFAVFSVPTANPTVELIGGNPPVVKPVVGSFVEDDVSGQRWEKIPTWLAGSTVHMMAEGSSGMSMKMTCPSNSGNLPCTFYVTFHNCLPCSSAMNGGFPRGLLDAGFEAGSCGPKYVPTFMGAPSEMNPRPTAIFKMEVAAGEAPVIVPVMRDFLHVSVFVQNSGQQCSLHHDEAACSGDAQCRHDALKGCLEKPLCRKAPAPVRTGNGMGAPKCTCFDPPSLSGPR